MALEVKAIAKRLPALALTEESLAWLASAPIGSIRIHEQSPYPSDQVYHSFTNTPLYGDEVYLWPQAERQQGEPQVHVAVGFLDLSSAAAAAQIIAEQGAEVQAVAPLSSGQPSCVTQDPIIRWVGYDSSPHAVAKSLIIAQMLHEGAALDQVLQVSASCGTHAHTL